MVLTLIICFRGGTIVDEWSETDMSERQRGILYTAPPAPDDTPVRNRPPAIAATLEREAERQDEPSPATATSTSQPAPADD